LKSKNTKSDSQVKKLWLFNLETNLDSDLLAVSHDWVLEMSKHFSEICVYSTHVGVHRLPKWVIVKELGGGSVLGRIKALFRLICAVIEIGKNRKSATVFYHMSSRVSAIIGLPLKLLSVRQGLWYSHAHTSTSMKIAKHLVDVIFTPSSNSVSFASNKLRFVRNGVPRAPFDILENLSEPRKQIVSVGRIAPVKQLDKLLYSLGTTFNNNREQVPTVTFIGPISDRSYRNYLSKVAEKEGIVVTFMGKISYADIPLILKNFSIYYTGTNGGVDKAAIEAGMCGCFVVSPNWEALDLVGMKKFYSEVGINVPITLEEQLKVISSDMRFNALKRSQIRKFGLENNSLEKVVERVVRELSKTTA
jgi:glycosyltransferase involved in cell wall biosynthesis